jgi:predicted phosphoadenosine phosphosulfate sulfurtransferase
MVIYSDKNVFEAGLDRIRYIFDEFENVVVGFSGGKDSTTCLHLSLIVAKEKNRLPLKVLFLDQEAEWQNTIDYIEEVMYMPEVDPYWYQIPIKLFNATSINEPWLYCWEEGKEWMRDKDSISKKVNIYGTDRFVEMFTRIANVEWGDKKTAYISGVRCEESPARKMGLTEGSPTYKWITWGKILDKKINHYTFYPIYDWSFRDIWKAIHDNNWKYNKIYDYQYSHGISINEMRVSNVHHETAVKSLYSLQEIESETWQKLTKRIQGINTVGQLKDKAFEVKELPYMFKDWTEYRDYLLDNLIEDAEIKISIKDKFDKYDLIYTDDWIKLKYIKVCIATILFNDFHFTKLVNFQASPDSGGYRQFKRGKITKYTEHYAKLGRGKKPNK